MQTCSCLGQQSLGLYTDALNNATGAASEESVPLVETQPGINEEGGCDCTGQGAQRLIGEMISEPWDERTQGSNLETRQSG